MINEKQKIGVIAGTPVDTQMGVDFILAKGHEAIGVPTASCPQEQNLLQFLSPDVLTEKVSNIIKGFQEKGIYRTMLYCNSLSSAINLEKIKTSFPQSRIMTPLDVYENLASRYKNIILWAANVQCLEGIEKIFYEKNPFIDIMGFSMLPVIKAIEALEPPAQIIDRFNLNHIVAASDKAECLVLGCTHLPYLKENLQKKAGIAIIDPAEEMLEKLLSD